MLAHIPLTAEAEALKKQILAIPRTDQPLDDDTPPELSPEQMEDLYYACCEGANWAIAELKKLIARYPSFPTLRNYLHTIYQQRNQPRQAKQVLKDLAKFHPDYLFTRIGLALDALHANNAEAAVQALGPALDITKLYPERELFHVSELKNYYLAVALYQARSTDPMLACGLLAVIEVIDPDCDACRLIEREILIGCSRQLEENMQVIRAQRIEVKLPPLPQKITEVAQPTFHHQEIQSLYAHSMALPLTAVTKILSLPRETLVADLIHVLDDGILRTPYFMSQAVKDEEAFAPVHALHFLAELNATESLDAVLRFLSLHPDALAFWFENSNHCSLFADIIRGDLPRVTAWLKSPGISCTGKSKLTDAMTHLARVEPPLREEVISRLEEVLTFLIASPRADNVLDTQFISSLVWNCTDLRAIRLLPLITQAWEKNYLEEYILGSLHSISQDIAEPPPPAPATYSIVNLYKSYQPKSSPLRSGLMDSNRAAANDEPIQLHAGRNDPCPCGSGKKYKKCCLR